METTNRVKPTHQGICKALEASCFREISGPLRRFIEHFSGVDSFIERPEDEPYCQIAQVLEEALDWNPKAIERWVICRVSRLQVSYYRVFAGDLLWNSLAAAFSQLASEQHRPEVQLGGSPLPPP